MSLPTSPSKSTEFNLGRIGLGGKMGGWLKELLPCTYKEPDAVGDIRPDPELILFFFPSPSEVVDLESSICEVEEGGSKERADTGP